MSRYTHWKSWDVEDFAEVSNSSALYFSKIFKQFLKGDQIPKKILEIGYGNGEFLGWCRQSGHQVSGIEVDQVLVERAQAKGFDVGVSLDAMPTHNFDAIFLFDVLEHVPQDQIESFMLNLHDRLSEGGRVVVRTPNGASPLGLANQHGDPTHITVVTTTKIHFWSGATGFRVIYSGRDLYPVYDGRLLKVPGRLIKIVLRSLIEKVLRFIFSPQSYGVLSANLLSVLVKGR